MSGMVPGFVIVCEEEEGGEGTVHTAVTDKTGIQKLVTLSEVSSLQQELPTSSEPSPCPQGAQAKKGPPYTCNVCAKTLQSFKSLKRHKRTLHPELPEEDEEVVLSEAQKQGRKYSILVQDHVGTGSPAKRRSTNLVKDEFVAASLADELKTLTHVTPSRRRKYKSTKQYTCEVCEKAFVSPSLLKRHSVVHTGEKPYACMMCDKKYSQAERLHRHMGIHARVNLFKCKACGKHFVEKCRYIDHLRSHLEEKPYECDVCQKVFTCRVGLWKHKSIHTGDNRYYGESCAAYKFKCEVCSKKFRLKQELIRHNRTHTGQAPEKPFSCPECKKRFSRKVLMETHFRSHTGERPFVCPHCFKNFACKRSRSCHMKLHKLGLRQKPDSTAAAKPSKKPVFHCLMCDKHFQNKEQFSEHFSDEHNMTVQEVTEIGSGNNITPVGEGMYHGDVHVSPDQTEPVQKSTPNEQVSQRLAAEMPIIQNPTSFSNLPHVVNALPIPSTAVDTSSPILVNYSDGKSVHSYTVLGMTPSIPAAGQNPGLEGTSELPVMPLSEILSVGEVGTRDAANLTPVQMAAVKSLFPGTTFVSSTSLERSDGSAPEVCVCFLGDGSMPAILQQAEAVDSYVGNIPPGSGGGVQKSASLSALNFTETPSLTGQSEERSTSDVHIRVSTSAAETENRPDFSHPESGCLESGVAQNIPEPISIVSVIPNVFTETAPMCTQAQLPVHVTFGEHQAAYASNVFRVQNTSSQVRVASHVIGQSESFEKMQSLNSADKPVTSYTLPDRIPLHRDESSGEDITPIQHVSEHPEHRSSCIVLSESNNNSEINTAAVVTNQRSEKFVHVEQKPAGFEIEEQIRKSLRDRCDIPDRADSFAPSELLKEFMPPKRTRRKSV